MADKKPIDEKRVYVALFEGIRTTESFVKVGISKNPLNVRFSNDVDNYNISLMFESEFYEASDAYIVETNIHETLKFNSIRPRLPLKSGGNTDCCLNLMRFF